MPLDATNSYGTLAEAEDYFASTLYEADWTAVTNKEAAMLQACRWMETLSWPGEKAVSTQPLQWPRIDIVCGGTEATADAIPPQVLWTQYELALALATDPRALMQKASKDGPIKSEKIGPLEQEYYAPPGFYATADSISGTPDLLEVFPWVKTMLGCWLSRGCSRDIRLVRN